MRAHRLGFKNRVRRFFKALASWKYRDDASVNSVSEIGPRLLSYESLEAWQEGEGLPKNWLQHSDDRQRDIWLTQFTELRQHLWSLHIATLPEEEQRQFDEGVHPSMSHKFSDRALPFAVALKEELAKQGYGAEVKIGYYHCDRIVLSAVLDRTPPGRTKSVPWLFHGFEVHYRFPDTDAHTT